MRFQQRGILTCVRSEEPVLPRLKLRNSKWCSVSSLTVIEYSSNSQRLWSYCAYAQSDLRLCLSHIPHCWTSHVAAQICSLVIGWAMIWSAMLHFPDIHFIYLFFFLKRPIFLLSIISSGGKLRNWSDYVCTCQLVHCAAYRLVCDPVIFTTIRSLLIWRNNYSIWIMLRLNEENNVTHELNISYYQTIPGRLAQSVMYLAADASLTADPGIASSISARPHTFVEIDHKIIDTVILLPSA